MRQYSFVKQHFYSPIPITQIKLPNLNLMKKSYSTWGPFINDVTILGWGGGSAKVTESDERGLLRVGKSDRK